MVSSIGYRILSAEKHRAQKEAAALKNVQGRRFFFHSGLPIFATG